jgi:hypothetical protein
MSWAEIVACNSPALMNVVGCATPFHCTSELAAKFDPEIVSVNPGPPKPAAPGDRNDKLGTGFGVTLIVNAFDAAVPGLLTVIDNGPTVVKSAAGIVKI